MIRAAIVLILFSINLTVWGTVVLLVGVVKFLTPQGRARRRLILTLASLGEGWVAMNNRISDLTLPIRWEITGVEGLRHDGHYLVFANHISWFDIIVVFRALHRRTALIRFFTKQNLIWLPFIGQACWALEFPFMKRYSADYLARHPEKRGTDLATTRRACERYRTLPVAVLNFLEATRFTRDKHSEQESPYRYLLRPRTGAAAFVVASLGDQLDGILDLTIAYPGHLVTAWQVITGRVKTIRAHVRQLPIPPVLLTSAVTEPGPVREQFREWIERVWTEKDAVLAELLARTNEP
ncbi:MAG TPA: acetyltransferase [Thermoanaerobaculia bacterium]|nr:acetyltransferase [Thermoanaerobaculia bacterium]